LPVCRKGRWPPASATPAASRTAWPVDSMPGRCGRTRRQPSGRSSYLLTRPRRHLTGCSSPPRACCRHSGTAWRRRG
jgi:hypothetical protein